MAKFLIVFLLFSFFSVGWAFNQMPIKIINDTPFLLKVKIKTASWAPKQCAIWNIPESFKIARQKQVEFLSEFTRCNLFNRRLQIRFYGLLQNRKISFGFICSGQGGEICGPLATTGLPLEIQQYRIRLMMPQSTKVMIFKLSSEIVPGEQKGF